MHYNIAIFSQFVVTPTRYIINAMDRKIHEYTIKSGPFEEFLNWCNIDYLVINFMSGCNCKNCKLNNNLA